MSVKNMLTTWFVSMLLVVVILTAQVIAEVLYVHSTNGNDTNPGTKDKPLRTIARAAVIINDNNERGPTTIKIEPCGYVKPQRISSFIIISSLAANMSGCAHQRIEENIDCMTV